jgi:ABC-type uncharacterized transport system ATPase subunit
MSGSGRIHLRVASVSDSLKTTLAQIPGVRAVNAYDGGQLEIDTDGSKEISQALAAKVVGAGVGLLELREETFNLEDIFLKLTTSEETQGVAGQGEVTT